MKSAKEQNTESCFVEEIRLHQGILHKICIVYATNRAEREDLYQEMVLQLWKSYPSFKGDAQFSTWMYRVCLNTALMQTRRKRPEIMEVKSSALDFVEDEQAGVSEKLRVLYMAISRLSKIERALILLWLDEKSYEEIAKAIGISVKNVSVRLVRIKARLTSIIEKLQQDEDN